MGNRAFFSDRCAVKLSGSMVLQERLDSSGRDRNEYINQRRPDDQDGPAAPGPGPLAQNAPDPADRLRRALSRNTMLPQDVPSTSESAASGKGTDRSAGGIEGCLRCSI